MKLAMTITIATFLLLLVGSNLFADEEERFGPCPFDSCVNRLVTNDGDDGGRISDTWGTLRAVISAACNNEGDDRLDFGFRGMAIHIVAPIVIPPDCNGRIAIYGREDGKSILDGSRTRKTEDDPWENCLLMVHSSSNIISRLYFVGFNSGEKASVRRPGVGLCLIGNENEVTESGFGIVPNKPSYEGNDIGVFIGGRENHLTGNHISNNLIDGLVVTGSENVVRNNVIGEHNPGCGKIKKAGKKGVKGCEHFGNGRDGIRVLGGAHDNTIGGSSGKKGASNKIEFNGQNGVSIIGTTSALGNKISHNVISRNGGIGIDLTQDDEVSVGIESDGVTENDPNDEDEGPNAFLNYPEGFVVHMREYYEGGAPNRSYDLYGVAPPYTTLELYSTYGVYGGADERQGWYFIQDVEVSEDPFFTTTLPGDVPTGSRLASLAADEEGNTSEFSDSPFLDRDTDLDGISDRIEDKNLNGVVDEDETDPFHPDTDGDGLMDSVEDRNKNGEWNEGLGETSGYLADSDEDGVSDYIETRGDGVYDPLWGDTNPLDDDTDDDGTIEGEEDTNSNGILETNLGETNPN